MILRSLMNSGLDGRLYADDGASKFQLSRLSAAARVTLVKIPGTDRAGVQMRIAKTRERFNGITFGWTASNMPKKERKKPTHMCTETHRKPNLSLFSV